MLSSQPELVDKIASKMRDYRDVHYCNYSGIDTWEVDHFIKSLSRGVRMELHLTDALHRAIRDEIDSK